MVIKILHYLKCRFISSRSLKLQPSTLWMFCILVQSKLETHFVECTFGHLHLPLSRLLFTVGFHNDSKDSTRHCIEVWSAANMILISTDIDGSTLPNRYNRIKVNMMHRGSIANLNQGQGTTSRYCLLYLLIMISANIDDSTLPSRCNHIKVNMMHTGFTAILKQLLLHLPSLQARCPPLRPVTTPMRRSWDA